MPATPIAADHVRTLATLLPPRCCCSAALAAPPACRNRHPHPQRIIHAPASSAPSSLTAVCTTRRPLRCHPLPHPPTTVPVTNPAVACSSSPRPAGLQV